MSPFSGRDTTGRLSWRPHPRSCRAAAVTAIARECRNDRGVAQREEEADRDRALSILHQLAGNIIDCRAAQWRARKVIGVCLLLVTANVVAWLWALIAFCDYPIPKAVCEGRTLLLIARGQV
jgi:hypothetical protein